MWRAGVKILQHQPPAIDKFWPLAAARNISSTQGVRRFCSASAARYDYNEMLAKGHAYEMVRSVLSRLRRLVCKL
jgi:hypothetical protein